MRFWSYGVLFVDVSKFRIMTGMSDYEIEQIDSLPPDIEHMVDHGHSKDEADKGIVCDYKKFSIVIKNSKGEVVGVLTAYTAYAEIYVDDIWVKPAHRGKNLGRRLLQALEARFTGKGYNNINLVTSKFQAPEFYEKCGFEKEFMRENEHNPKLSKIFFIKFFDDKVQNKGIL